MHKDIFPVGHKVKCLVLALYADFEDTGPAMMDGITSILILTPHMCRLFFIYPAMFQSALLCLTYPSRQTLSSLSFSLSPVSSTALALLNQLIALEELSICSCIDKSWNLTAWNSITLPRVHTFTWTHEHEVFDDPGMIDFLGGCRFHPNCAIELVIHGDPSEYTPGLIPLFQNHTCSRIKLDIETRALLPLCKDIMRTSHLEIGLVDEHALDLFKEARLPKILFLETSSYDYASLVIILEDLATRTRGAYTTFVHVRVTPDEEFNWSGGTRSRKYATFVDVLQHHAHKLFGIGIMIVDETGVDVTSLVHQSS
jgi:hypothetical protein